MGEGNYEPDMYGRPHGVNEPLGTVRGKRPTAMKTRHCAIPLPWPERVLGIPDKIPVVAELPKFDTHEHWPQLEEILRKRAKDVQAMEADPFRFGWQPEIWIVCDCMLGFDWIPADFAAEVREALGFKKAIDILLINGGNRAGKSEYCAKTVLRLLWKKPKSVAWMFHTSEPNSVQMQQPVIHKYQVPEIRGRKIKSDLAYISYRQQTGYSDGKFILPNGSMGVFRNYEQDIRAVEGGEVDLAWLSELSSPDLVETLNLRLATRAGKMLVDFTPVMGYSPTVKLFLDGARPVMRSPAWLVPKDGKPADIDRQLGFTSPEALEPAATFGPDCVPEPVLTRIVTGDLLAKQREIVLPNGRKFETLPRVMKCAPAASEDEAARAVVFFHSSDNPFGNPRQVAQKVLAKNTPYVRERFYGIANKLQQDRFPAFRREVHCIPRSTLPKIGTRYLLCDPASARNFFMLLVLVTPEATYVEDEWPGRSEIPGVGVPGPWTLPDGKKADGRKGPGQSLFGFGLHQYKLEVAKFEGWKAYTDWEAGIRATDRSLNELVAEWDDSGPASRKVFARFMDSRFANVNSMALDDTETLLDQFAGVGLGFLPAHATQGGAGIDDGVSLINSDLSYDTTRPLDFFNKPHLFICDECDNMIYSLENWTGKDGQAGASKDPIDCLRMRYLKDLQYISNESKFGDSGSGCY